MKHASLICLIIGSFARAAVANDYPYFITEEIPWVSHGQDGVVIVDPAWREKCKQTNDCQPAAQDPEGNWGVASNGMQVSIRFEKNSFAANEPITAIVIFRNVSDGWRAYDDAWGLATFVSVLNPEQKQLNRKDLADPNTGVGRRQREPRGFRVATVDPGMQRKLKTDLQPHYDFSIPGKYVISVKMKTYQALNSKNTVYVESGNAIITVTNSSPASTNTPASK